MIGQKRRQATIASESGSRIRAASVGGDSMSSSSSDEGSGMLFFRHIPRSSWFCRKFWKCKSSKNDHSVNENGERSQSLRESSTASSAPAASSGASATSDFVQRQRHRYRRFCKSVIKRSRTSDGFDRHHAASGDALGDDYALATEEDLKRLEAAIARLLDRLNNQPDDGPAFPDEECVICVTGRASMQTFPCGHKVLCKTCFVRTIQVALQERQLPLRCIVCRSRIVRLKQQPAPCRVVVKKQQEPPGSYYLPPAPSPLPPSGIRRPGYM